MKRIASSKRRGSLSSSFAFYLLHSGFQVFKSRLREEMESRCGVELDEVVDDETLFPLYRQGEPTEYVMERLCGSSDK